MCSLFKRIFFWPGFRFLDMASLATVYPDSDGYRDLSGLRFEFGNSVELFPNFVLIDFTPDKAKNYSLRSSVYSVPLC